LSKRQYMLMRMPASCKSAIQAQAHKLGFELVGVTNPNPPTHFHVFEAWLESGRHGEMTYLATERSRQRRADPQHILPGCRSIVVLGMRYPAPERCTDNKPAIRGRVAAYAWGQDYHLVIAERLRSLAQFIENWQGEAVSNRGYSDTGPLLERDLAQRAGLGWIGKNTCLIHPRLGSYYFLAAILLELELEPDPPFTPDRCGSCTLCIEACPTACIQPDRTLDARRCISYLTIELKGAIPLELRPQIGNWIFGCDICQQVCPWNQRFAQPDGEAAFEPRPLLPCPDLTRELMLSIKDFNRKFKDSPVKRTKRRGYLRNIAVALANMAKVNPGIVPATIAALTAVVEYEPEPLVRAHAAWGLGYIGNRSAHQALLGAIKKEKDPYVLKEIRYSL
jgi:epoxyqueuosine reductase